uniref:Endophilin-A2 n=1 Tax=Neogobius melanostomus TaxID=47308 RepID=A0A8C6TEK3_9GOBI
FLSTFFFLLFPPQMMSEKVGGAEGTKLEEDFLDLERKSDVTSKAVVEVLNKTSEYLQPNPATRAKLTMLNTVSKIRGQEKNPGYPQPEGLLGDCMLRYGREMGDDSNFGVALTAFGESMKRMEEVKYSLDMDVKQNFLDPLQAIAEKDIKDIQFHLKKLESRRKIPDEEIRQSLDKFHESKEMAERSMHSLLETDVEQVSQLKSFVESMLQYHREATGILEGLQETLTQRSKGFRCLLYQNGFFICQADLFFSFCAAEPSCKALYDFEPENEGELGFQEGDMITLTNRIDDNWLEGRLHGRTGYFPVNYVEVLGALPF